MKVKKQLLILTSLSILNLPISILSCSSKLQEKNNVNLVNLNASNLKAKILNKVEFNNAEITIFDASNDFGFNPLKITNLAEFKKKKINLSIIFVDIDLEREQVIIKLLYSYNNYKDYIYINKSFSEFKTIDIYDKDKIFNELSKFTYIKWMGIDDKQQELYEISNKYAQVSDVIISSYNQTPSATNFSYNLTLKKFELDSKPITSSYRLSGGALHFQQPVNIKLIAGSESSVIVSKTHKITKPKLIPQKSGYIFLGWASHPNLQVPNLFVDKQVIEFNQDSSIYAVFKKLPSINFRLSNIFNHKIQEFSLTLDESGYLSKDKLEQFIEQIKPQPKEKYYLDLETLSFSDEKGVKHRFEFDTDNKSLFQFKSDIDYEVNINFSHDPILIFRSQEDNKLLGSIWLELKDIAQPDAYLIPAFSLDLEKYEQRGWYVDKLKFKDSLEPYIPNKILHCMPNSIHEVLVSFKRSKFVNIDISNIKQDKLEKSYIFLTSDNKIKQSYLPQKIDYSWYDGPLETLWNASEAANNLALDPRELKNELESIEFEGWYLDSDFKNKIEFENGISKQEINSTWIYPKFSINKWDKIRDAREIVNTILIIATSLAKMSIESIKQNKEDNSKFSLDAIPYSLNVFKWIIYLSMGGITNFKELIDDFKALAPQSKGDDKNAKEQSLFSSIISIAKEAFSESEIQEIISLIRNLAQKFNNLSPLVRFVSINKINNLIMPKIGIISKKLIKLVNSKTENKKEKKEK